MGSEPCYVMSYIKTDRPVLLAGGRNIQRVLLSALKKHSARC